MARPVKPVSSEQVKQLAMIGCTIEEMEAVLGIGHTTIYRRYGKELKEGQFLRNVSLRRRQFERAMEGNPHLLIFLGKQYLGQSDKAEVSGRDGGPIEHAVTVTQRPDLSRYTDEQLLRFRDVLRAGATQQIGPGDGAGKPPEPDTIIAEPQRGTGEEKAG